MGRTPAGARPRAPRYPRSRGQPGPGWRAGLRTAGGPEICHFSPLIRGHAVDAPEVPFNHPWWGPIRSKESYAARSWYLSMVRAYDCLLALDGWVDPDRILVAGGSQGGALALAAAALEPRYKHCIAGCPSNAQTHELMHCYDGFGPSVGALPAGVTEEAADRILSYFDPANLAARIRVPTTIGINIGDPTVHVLGPLACYTNLTRLDSGEKEFLTGLQPEHGSGERFQAREAALLDHWAL
jgi:Acetyl esterase (deacetylase)